MFDKLVDFLLQFVYDFIPIFFVKEYNKGVQFRSGRFLRIVNPGLRWKVPFFDSYELKAVVTTTLSIPTQSLTTKDNKRIVVKAVVKYNISDVKKFILDVYDGYDAIGDTTQAIVKEIIMERTWEECLDNKVDNMITIKLRSAIKHWGIEVEKVTLTDLGLINSLRLFNDPNINT